MGVFQNNLMGAAAAAASAGGADFYDYQIQNSARFLRTGDNTNTYLKRTPSSAGNRKTYTLSLWVKRTQTTTLETFASAQVTSTTNYVDGYKFGSAQYDNSGLSLAAKGTLSGSLITSAAYRDLSAWMHIVIRVDSTQTTAANRFRLYVNGEQVTAFGTETYIAEDYEGGFCSTREHAIGWGTGANNGQGFFGYMAEVILADGTSYAPTQFGESKNGVWIPKDPDGTSFGTTGFHLDFASSSDLGNDVSGNNNDFTNVGMSAHDQMLDTPTFDSSSNGGNYCVMNALNSGSNNTFSEGNLKVTNTSGGCSALGTMSLVTGHKWYFEGKVTGSGNNWIGIIEENGYTNSANTNSSIAGSGSFNTYLYGYNGSIYHGSSSTATGATITTDDIIGVLVDLESATNTIQFYKNGAAQGSAFNLTGTGINYTPMSDRGSSTGNGFWFNFGQEGTFGTGSGGGNSDVNGYGSFYYDDGAAAKALCTANLPVVDAVDPAQTDDNYPQKLFGVTTWTGDGNTSRAITGLGFQPDWLWFKARDSAFSHRIYDTSRGISSTGGKRLFSNTTGVEVDQTSGQDISAVGSDGFTLGASSANYTNDTNNDAGHVNFAWRANGGTTSTNTQGDTNSTVQVDPSGHFSIVQGVGDNDSWGNPQTFGHGLSAAPTCIIGKKRADNDDEWQVFFSDYGNATIGGSNAASNSLVLNSTAALYTNQSYKGWGGVMPTSTVFTLDGNNLVQNGDTFVCYCFANCEGYIKSGAYEGNGNADGSFIYTGFKPAWLMLKQLDSTSNWNIFDTTRDPYNYTSKHVAADSSAIEYDGSSYSLDILSNGFKMVSTWGQINGNGNDYVFIAMAHNPLKYATAR